MLGRRGRGKKCDGDRDGRWDQRMEMDTDVLQGDSQLKVGCTALYGQYSSIVRGMLQGTFRQGRT